MSNPDSQRLIHPRADEDQPTVIDPALLRPDTRGSSVGHAVGPVVMEDEKTVISHRPPPAATWSASSSATELGVLLQGKQLGHFTLEKFVGGGGMGAVFRGRDNLLGRVVAVKVLSRDQGSDLETLRRFKNEAQSAARLDHDNIARVFFVGEDDGWNFIVFEFIDGTNIRDLVDQDGPLPLELAIDFTIQIAEALAHAAEREVVHRDIKPSNILVTVDRHAKLVDMGLARLHQMEAGESDLTASGVTLGTFDYISPEQASDPRRADVRSDLYSLGCTLFYMLTGRPPFSQGTVLQKLLAHSGEAPPDPRDDRPELPEAVTKIVHRLMAKRPEQRYREPAELIGDLLVLRERLGLASYGAAGAWVAEPTPTPWRDRMLTWGAPLALLLILFAGLHAYWATWNSEANALPAFRRPATRLQSVIRPESLPAEAPQAPDVDREPRQGKSSVENSSAKTSSDSEVNSSTSTSRSSDSPLTISSPSSSNTPVAAKGGGEETSRRSEDPAAVEGFSPLVEATPEVDRGRGSATEPPFKYLVRLIVIGDASKLGDLGETVAVYGSLGDALRDPKVRAHLSEIQAIEIRAPVVVERAPLIIALPQDAVLNIRGVPSTDGQLPLVRFATLLPRPADFSGALVQIIGGKVAWNDVQLELEVGEPSPIGDLALLRLAADSGAHLELRRCIVTIDNPAVDAPDAAFIDIQTNSDDSAVGIVPVSLSDSVFRGRATLVRMRESVGLDLDWSNGLLVSNAPLLDASGAAQPFDDSGEGTIRLRLDDVTISTTSDFCLLQDSTAKPHQPALELECNRCIIRVGGSVIVHDGVGDAAKYAESLHISGSHNFYEGVDVFWRAYVDGVEQATWDWPAWKKQLMRDGMPSYIGPVRWNRSRSDVLAVPPHLHGTDDHVLDPAASNPAVRDGAGFIAASLPPLVRLRKTAVSTEPASTPVESP